MKNTYWNGNGELQNEYNTMVKATEAGSFSFTKENDRAFYSYYRYYNDGNLPGWARSAWELTQTGRWGKELNAKGEEELERRTTERIAAEWKRFNR